jgi:hypothetical protein
MKTGMGGVALEPTQEREFGAGRLFFYGAERYFARCRRAV